MSVLLLIEQRLDEMQASGHRPLRLILGQREADELDAELRPTFYPPKPPDEPLLPYPMSERATLYDVPIERIDLPSFLGVVGEDGIA